MCSPCTGNNTQKNCLMICKRYFRVASIKYLLLLLFSSLIFLLTRLVKQYCNELGLVVFHLSYQ